MAAHGMHQPADFQFVMAGAHPQRWEALKAGTLDAAIQLVPFNYIAEESGFSNLGDVDEYVLDFLFCAVCTRMNWANENRDRLIGLLRALRRGVEALYDDPSGAASVVLDKISIDPDHALRACREFVSKKVIPRDLSINPHALAATSLYDGKTKEASFNLGNASDIRNKLAHACDWDDTPSDPVGSVDHSEHR